MSKRCKKCGELGHNSRTCGKEKVVKKKGVRICSNCGGEGHNIRTCPIINGKRKVVVKVSNRVCSYCGEKGHNKRTCLRIQTKCILIEKEKVDYIKTKFKDEDDFLNSVLGITYDKGILDIDRNLECISVMYMRDRLEFDKLVKRSGYYLLVKGDKYIEIVKKSSDEYTIRRGKFGGVSKMKIKQTENMEADFKKYIEHYSSYELVSG